MAKQRPTMTPREALAAARTKDSSSGNLGSLMGDLSNMKKLGMAPMPAEEPNDFSMGFGARQKVPIRYD